MKKYILLLHLVWYCAVSAQIGYVEYGYIESMGLGNAQGLDYNAVLLFDKNNSNYVTGKKSLETPEKISATKVVEEDGEVKAVFNGMGVSDSGNQVYFSNSNQNMLSTLHFKGKTNHIHDGVVNIDWKIHNDTKKIGEFKCTKATAQFRGRNYTAWFTTDLPLSYGPWKLNGLPGLILEAYDDDKYVYWYFKNIEYPSRKAANIKCIADIKSADYMEYANFKKMQQKERIKIEEKNRVLMRDVPGMEIVSPKLNELFVECE